LEAQPCASKRLDELASIVEWVDDLALEPKWRPAAWHTTPVDGRTEIRLERNDQ
jgi:hypothetical protein